jgi:phosphoribosylformimino-5-aminoimidazole carboxamide ribotide isomerase
VIAWAAIDLLDGRAVRLEQGRESRRLDFGRATDVFKDLVSRGIRWFHVVDLDAAFGRESTLPGFLRAIGNGGRGVRLQVAGGIRSIDAAQRMLDLGAARVVVGSLIFRAPEACARLVSDLGPDRCVAAIDFRSGLVRIEGWKTSVGSTQVGLRVARALGFAEALVTDIGRDGMMRGPNLALVRSLSDSGLRIVASGGVTSPRHLRALAAMTHVSGAVVGKALYLGRIRPEEIREHAS